MKILRAALIGLAGIVVASCSEKATPKSESLATATPRALPREAETGKREGHEGRPEQDRIAEDCVAFVRATKVVPAQTRSAECPECPADGNEALSFRHMETEGISCSGDMCTVTATIRAVFNSAFGERFSGGLAGWIPTEQRFAYLRGEMPAGEQSYRVRITYRRHGEDWRAVDFDRLPLAQVRE